MIKSCWMVEVSSWGSNKFWGNLFRLEKASFVSLGDWNISRVKLSAHLGGAIPILRQCCILWCIPGTTGKPEALFNNAGDNIKILQSLRRTVFLQATLIVVRSQVLATQMSCFFVWYGFIIAFHFCGFVAARAFLVKISRNLLGLDKSAFVIS